MDWEPLIAAARRARQNAYAPYSGFRVGAALLIDDGTIVTGCNVENRSYGATVCAERSALAAAVVAGVLTATDRGPDHPILHAVAAAVVSDTTPPAPPCGICLQAFSEFSKDLPILLCNLEGEHRELRLGELLPFPFESDLPNQRGRSA